MTALVATTMASSRARPCAVCETGDRTLSTLGIDRPYAGRVRASLTTAYLASHTGSGGGRLNVDEWRFELAASIAATADLSLELLLPLIERELSWSESGLDRVSGLGDLLFRMRLVVLRDRPRHSRHLLSVIAGLGLPTAGIRRYPSGAPMILDQQRGAGALTPLGGIAWDAFLDDWALRASVLGTWTTVAIGGERPSRSLELALLVERQIVSGLAVRGGLSWRVDGEALEGGEPARHSGGSIVSGTFDVLVSPITDLTLVASMRVPLVDALAEGHEQGIGLGAGVGYDFH